LIFSTTFCLKHFFFLKEFSKILSQTGEGGGTVGDGTKLQARMPWVRFPIMSMEFVTDLTLRAAQLGLQQE